MWSISALQDSLCGKKAIFKQDTSSNKIDYTFYRNNVYTENYRQSYLEANLFIIRPFYFFPHKSNNQWANYEKSLW